MTGLSDLPTEIVTDFLIPHLSSQSLTALGAVNRTFQDICNDEYIWKRKCKEDFNFSSSATARTKGWKFIYKGLRNPKVFVWGSAGNGRLGIPDIRRTSGGVPYPKRIHFPRNSSIVDIIAGGWSFNALDSWGRIFVWGTLDGEMIALQSDGFSVSQKIAESPLRLNMPEPIKSLSCGRKHTMALDEKGQVWTFLSWGRPFRLVSPALDNSSADSTPIQIESGWMYCAVLTESGNVFIWWPFIDEVQQLYGTKMHDMDQTGDNKAHAVDGSINCVTWDLKYNPRQLPLLPQLPELNQQNIASERNGEETKIVKIAGMDNNLVALTNKGHVLKFSGLGSPSSLQAEGRWEYLPSFSEVEKIHVHPVFCGEEAKKSTMNLAPPTEFRITHITAHFRHFFAYTHETNSIVLGGNADTTSFGEHAVPHIIPELQYKQIISISLGDYHFAALTADGKLFTWGGFQQGALGLGDPTKLPVGAPGGYNTQRDLDRARQGGRIPVPPAVDAPTEVRFDHDLSKRKEMFCFAATAAGWHTGALVIDLDPDDEEDVEVEPTSQMPGHLEPETEALPQFGPGQLPGILPVPSFGHSPFRVGFAGRGRFRPLGRGEHNGSS